MVFERRLDGGWRIPVSYKYFNTSPPWRIILVGNRSRHYCAGFKDGYLSEWWQLGKYYNDPEKIQQKINRNISSDDSSGIVSSLHSSVVSTAVIEQAITTRTIRTLLDFSFAAAGDWACNSNTISTVNNIAKKNPSLVLGLGDYYYSDYTNESQNPDCWFTLTKLIDQKMRIAIGNHENQPPSLLKLFINHFNLTKEYYSFNYQNVHFLALSTEMPLAIGSEQYNFAKNDLAKAASDPNIKWIVRYLPIY